MRISDWSSDVCSSDLRRRRASVPLRPRAPNIRACFRHGESTFQIRIRPASILRKIVVGSLPSGTALGVSMTSSGASTSWIGRTTKIRSEEHTSELQSLMRISYAVFCLKKKKIKYLNQLNTTTLLNETHKRLNKKYKY